MAEKLEYRCDCVEFRFPDYLSEVLCSVQQSHNTTNRATPNKAMALNVIIRRTEPNISNSVASGVMIPPRFILKGDGPS